MKTGNIASLSEAQFLSYHTQVAVKDMSGETIYVDEGLEVLLPILWELGFVTRFSCSGGTKENPSIVEYPYKDGYIFFDTELMAQSFIEIASLKQSVEDIRLEPALNKTIVRFPERMIASFINTFQAVTLHHPALIKLYESTQPTKSMKGF